jgi:hypothetical protein
MAQAFQLSAFIGIEHRARIDSAWQTSAPVHAVDALLVADAQNRAGGLGEQLAQPVRRQTRVVE